MTSSHSDARTQLIAGSVTLAIIVAMFTALIMSGDQTHSSNAQNTDTQILTATFGRIDGVDVGTEVRLAGVPVGAVTDVTLRSDLRVTLSLELDRRYALPDDTGATIETDGVFGSKYIELTPGGGFDILEDGGHLSYTQDSVIVEELVAKIVALGKAARRPSPAEPTELTP